MMNPVIDTGNLKHYDQLLKAVAGGSLTLSEDGKKFVLKSVDGKVLSEIDAPDAGGDSLKGNKITAALPISEGDIVVYGTHILNVETEEAVFGYMPLKDCHLISLGHPILGATANIAQGNSSEDVCHVGKFPIANIQEMVLTPGEPVFIRCQSGIEALTVNGLQLIVEAFKTYYPELGDLTYDAPAKLTQAILETYPEAEEGFLGKASDYILLGYAVSETEVLITADHPVFRDTTNGGVVKFVDAADYDGEGNLISSTYAKKSDVTTLPTASSTTLGGVKIGSNITVSSGTISLSKTNVTNALGYTPVKSVNGQTGDVIIEAGGGDYTLPTASSSTLGGVKIGSNITHSSGTISLTKSNVTDALGYTPLQTVPTASSSTLGGVKIGSNISVSSGTISLSKTNVTNALGYTPLSSTGTAAKATADASGNTITSTYAKLASPTFTGTPKAPTASASTNSTQIATTAFVQTAVSSIETGIPASGNRGSLAGYETVGSSSDFGSAYNASDSNQTASKVYVYDATSGTSWTKVVRLTSTSPAVSFIGNKWTWKDNTAPTLVTGGILVLCWCGDAGIANFISP